MGRKGEKEEIGAGERNERTVVKAETKMRGRCRNGGSRKEVETGWRGQQERGKKMMEGRSRMEKGVEGQERWKGGVGRRGEVEGGEKLDGGKKWDGMEKYRTERRSKMEGRNRMEGRST